MHLRSTATAYRIATERERVSPGECAHAENCSYYGQPNSYGVPKTVRVEGYYRSDGTYVRGYYRSAPGSGSRSRR